MLACFHLFRLPSLRFPLRRLIFIQTLTLFSPSPYSFHYALMFSSFPVVRGMERRAGTMPGWDTANGERLDSGSPEKGGVFGRRERGGGGGRGAERVEDE